MAEQEFDAPAGGSTRRLSRRRKVVPKTHTPWVAICTRIFSCSSAEGWRSLRAAWPCRPVSSQAHRAAIPPQSSPVCFSNQRDSKPPPWRASLRPFRRFLFISTAASRAEPQAHSLSGIAARLLVGYDAARRMTGFSLFGRGWLVTKKELAKAISEELGITSVLALQAVQRVFDGITKTLVEKAGHGRRSQGLGRRTVRRSEASSIPLTECGSPVGR